jgi:hypothetical protein
VIVWMGGGIQGDLPASGTRRTLPPVERHTPVLLVMRSGHTRRTRKR